MKIDCLSLIEEIRVKEVLPRIGHKQLTIIQVGDDEASNAYVRSKLREAPKWGVHCTLIKLPEDIDGMKLKERIERESYSSHGLIVQLPLPKCINTQSIIDAIHTDKNVDGFEQEDIKQVFTPCTPRGIMMLLNRITDLKGKRVTLVGRGKTVGEPLIDMLIKADCTLTVCHSKTKEKDLYDCLKKSDIVISAIGKPCWFNGYDVKEGAIVIDVGISRVNGKQVGDFDHKVGAEARNVSYTPWVNGVGKLTVAALMMNVQRILNV